MSARPDHNKHMSGVHGGLVGADGGLLGSHGEMCIANVHEEDDERGDVRVPDCDIGYGSRCSAPKIVTYIISMLLLLSLMLSMFLTCFSVSRLKS